MDRICKNCIYSHYTDMVSEEVQSMGYMRCSYYGLDEMYGTFEHKTCGNCVTTEEYDEAMEKYFNISKLKQGQ